MLCKSLLGAALLLNSCAAYVPNITACSAVEGFPGVGALCQKSNTDERTRLTLEEYLDFLYAQGERPDPKNRGKTLPPKGPAVCMPSEDYEKNDLAIAQLCNKGHCTYEQKRAQARLNSLVDDANKGGISSK